MEETNMNDSTNIVKQYVEAMNGHNIEKIRQLLHPKYSYTGGDGERQEGIEAGVNVATMYMNAFPDMKLEVKNTFSTGDIVITEFIAKVYSLNKPRLSFVYLFLAIDSNRQKTSGFSLSRVFFLDMLMC